MGLKKKVKNCKPCMTRGFTLQLHKACKGNGCKDCKFKGSLQKECPYCIDGYPK